MSKLVNQEEKLARASFLITQLMEEQKSKTDQTASKIHKNL
jgi:hypothetical protein